MVKAILMKMLTLDVLANPVKFNEVMGQLGQYFTVDEGLTNQVIFSTATSMRVNSGDDIVIQRAPFAARFLHPVGYSYFATLRNKLNWHELPILRRPD